MHPLGALLDVQFDQFLFLVWERLLEIIKKYFSKSVAVELLQLVILISPSKISNAPHKSVMRLLLSRRLETQLQPCYSPCSFSSLFVLSLLLFSVSALFRVFSLLFESSFLCFSVSSLHSVSSDFFSLSIF